MRYEYISWSRFYRLCGDLYRQIATSGYKPDLIVAITRGGYPGARIMADYFDLMDLFSLKIEHYRGPEKRPVTEITVPLAVDITRRHVLLVDDVGDSGDTFAVALRHMKEHGTPADLRTAALHYKVTSAHVPDYFAQRVVKWRWITYPWALVEDLTVLASRMQPPVKHIDDFKLRLSTEIGMRIPEGVLTQVAPIVFERLSEN